MNDYIDKLIEFKITKRILSNSKISLKSEIDELDNDIDNHRKAKWVISKVIEETQKTFKEQIESLTTLMLQSIFDDQYRFELIFEEKNNQIECRPVIFEGKYEYEAEEDMGGSIIDVISYALRVILHNIELPRSRDTMFSDEPMKWVGKEEELDRTGNILRDSSHELNMQLIIITHEKRLIEIADRAFSTKKQNGITTVTKVKG